MAELTARATGTVPDDRDDGHGPGADTPTASSLDDPRAVRVRLAPASAQGDEPAIRMAHAPEPLRMTNPTTGHGPLGGAVVAPQRAPAAAATPDADAVRAQGRPLLVDGEPADASLRALGRGRFVVEEGSRPTPVVLEAEHAERGGIRRREVLVGGFRFEVDVESERIAALRERVTRGRASSAHTGPLEVKAIIPGKVASVSVAPGDAVTAGQQLLVVEAMKMQNELRAPRDGTIDRVGVAPGVNIEVGDLLVVIS